MGGGDLNSKKSWHPNTMKNQERVWKAEQAAAEEKKRMIELQREQAAERDRAELNDIMRNNSTSASENRLSWMYDKPDKKVEQEAYLLGKALDRNSGQTENAEQDTIPAVSRRVVGSSMLTVAGDTQVDMSRKIREDPLLLIKERERAARAALLNNPLQRRRLAELLRKEQDQRKESKAKKISKKKDKDLDNLLAAKLNALGGEKGIDLATLLDSGDSSSDSEQEKTKKKKKKKKHSKEKSKKMKKRKHLSESETDNSTNKYKDSHNDTQRIDKKSSEYKSTQDAYYKEHRKRKSSGNHNRSRSRNRSESRHRSESPVARKYIKDTSENRRSEYKLSSRSYKDNKKNQTSKSSYRGRTPTIENDKRKTGLDHKDSKRHGGMSEEEKAARLAEMAAAGVEREIERGKRVAEQRVAEDEADKRAPRGPSRHDARALPDSLESRIHSTRHYIQRDNRYMNENFARR